VLNQSTSATTRGIAVTRRLLIAGLAGLLICYHFYTLYQLFLGTGPSFGGDFEYIQAPLRLIIALSLLCVVFGKRWALWGMWAGITALIATQYWAHFGHLPVEFTQGRHPLSYLKGFIFPTIITLAFLYSKPSARIDGAPNRAA
jgi:hypothetical protein